MTLTGTWDLFMKTPAGDRHPLLVVHESRDGFSGTMSHEGRDVAPLRDVKSDGNRFSWKIRAKLPLPLPLTIAFAVVIDGDSLTGTSKTGFFPSAAVTGKRRIG